MRSVVIILLISTQWVQAHSPDLSTLMLYEQNGKSLLVMKASLTAFEAEIDYHFGRNAYKTPEEFIQLVMKHFAKNVLIMVNGVTVRLINPQVRLGHEATLFAELQHIPKNSESYYIRCTLFQEMPNNQCELILATHGRPQVQYILYNSNNHEVTLHAENKMWSIDSPSFFQSNKNLIVWLSVFFAICITALFRKHRTTVAIKTNDLTLSHQNLHHHV